MANLPIFTDESTKSNDSLGKKNSEIDAIRNVNKKKGFGVNSDNVETPQSSQPLPPPEAPVSTGISGSDNSTPDSPENDTLNLDKATLEGLLNQAALKGKDEALRAIDPKIKQLEADSKTKDEQLREAEEQRRKLEDALDAEKKQKATLTQVFNDFGFSAPTDSDSRIQSYIAPMTMRGGISGRDAAKEFNRILDNDTPSVVVANPVTGAVYTHKDTRALNRFIRKHRDAVREGLEELMRKEGYLRGGKYSGSDASTTIADVPPAFLTYLSSVIRMEHSAQFILWQFPNRRVAAGIPPGQTTLVPRVRHLQTATSSSAWELTPGIPTTTERQPIQSDGISLLIKEYGMGKDANMKPVSVPDLIMSYSLLDLESVMNQRIGYNYHTFEDVALLETWLATTVVAYNKNGNVALTAGDLIATDGGQMTVAFLGSLFSYMASQKIPPYADGCYGLAVPPTHIAQLNKDMQVQRRYFDASSVEDLTSMLFKATQNDDLGRVSGYIGKISGFHIFQGNSFSTGIAGTAGVQSETIATAPTVTRSGFAFGADSVGWATAMPMEIRRDPQTNFDRMNDFIWKSHEGWAALDVDPAINAAQQLRVIEVRMTDTEI